MEDKETTVERIEYLKVIKYTWNEDSFAERTGNNCKKFSKNLMTNEIL